MKCSKKTISLNKVYQFYKIFYYKQITESLDGPKNTKTPF